MLNVVTCFHSCVLFLFVDYCLCRVAVFIGLKCFVMMVVVFIAFAPVPAWEAARGLRGSPWTGNCLCTRILLAIPVILLVFYAETRTSEDVLGPPMTSYAFLETPRTSQDLPGPPRTS